MLSRLAAWYSRRIVNVNVNVLVAGLLALIPVLLAVHLTEWALAKGIVDGDRLHVSDKVIIGVVTFVADIVFDVLIYYALHWLANHAPWLKSARLAQLEAVADAAIESSPFFKDATKVQVQRAMLSPLLYILWIGTQQTLMHGFHISTTGATIIGFLVGVGVARALHTYWMVQEERSRRAVGVSTHANNPDVLSAMTSEHPRSTKQPVWQRPKTGPAPLTDPAISKSTPASGSETDSGPTPQADFPAQSLSENGVKFVPRSK